MTIFFIDGFDKYGSPIPGSPAGAPHTFISQRLASLMSGEWNSVTTGVGSGIWVDAGLSSSGNSIGFLSQSGLSTTANKTFPANLARLIGGFRFKLSGAAGSAAGFAISENANSQARLLINSAGTFSLVNAAGTTVATSTASIAAGTAHYLEFDITFGATGAYNVYLDGVSIFSGTSNFKAGVNAYATAFAVGWVASTTSGTAFLVDDLYLDDGTGVALLTSPAIETTQMSSDNSVAFGTGNSIFGAWEILTGATNAPGANEIFLRKFTPTVSGNLASVSCTPNATSATAKFKAVVYTDSAGAPNTLLATGAEVVGTGTAAFNNSVTSAFGVPPALAAGTAYWIGFITDTSIALMLTDTSTSGVKAANTYTSGAPGTAPAMTTAQNNWCLWGTLTGVTSHTYDISQAPSTEIGDFTYVQSATVGNEDLFNVNGLVSNPSQIYTVAVKAIFKDSDAGARTVTLQTKSNTTDSASAAFAPTTTYGWFAGYWPTDPNGSVPWTKSNLNNALAGYKVAS